MRDGRPERTGNDSHGRRQSHHETHTERGSRVLRAAMRPKRLLVSGTTASEPRDGGDSRLPRRAEPSRADLRRDATRGRREGLWRVRRNSRPINVLLAPACRAFAPRIASGDANDHDYVKNSDQGGPSRNLSCVRNAKGGSSACACARVIADYFFF